MAICQQMLLHLCGCKRTYLYTRCRTFIGITTVFLPAPSVSTTNYNYSIHSPKDKAADHNCVHLLPTYQTVLKREKTQTTKIKDWTDESVLCLQDCFDCMDWEMFKQSCGDDLNELADVTCSYIAFCRDMIVPCKRVKIYSNNKPWITKTVKDSLQK